jgi:hypothetical protein
MHFGDEFRGRYYALIIANYKSSVKSCYFSCL